LDRRDWLSLDFDRFMDVPTDAALPVVADKAAMAVTHPRLSQSKQCAE